MALSTEFALPNASFDPTKYCRKASARTTNAVKALSQLNLEASTMTTPSSSEKLRFAGLSNNGTCSANTDTSTTAKHTTTSEKNKPALNPDVEAEQPTSSSSPEWQDVDTAMLKGHTMVSMSEFPMRLEQQAVVLSPKTVPTSSAPREGQPFPPTLLTAEMWNQASILPPDEPISTSTRRLVSIRRIRHIQQAKVENRWLTLAQVGEWTSIVPRRAYREGDLVVYVEIDAFLPSADERFGKMASLQTYDGELGHRVKTRRFGSHPDKLLVQGYIYPIEKFSEIYQEIKCPLQYLDKSSTNKSRQDMINEIICAIYRNRDWAVEIGVKKWEESKQVNKPDKHPKLGTIPTRVFKKTDITHFEVRTSWSDISSSSHHLDALLP